MIEVPTRRGIITGLASFIAAPAIVRISSIMPVKEIPIDVGFGPDVALWRDIDAMMRAFEEMRARVPQDFLVPETYLLHTRGGRSFHVSRKSMTHIGGLNLVEIPRPVSRAMKPSPISVNNR